MVRLILVDDEVDLLRGLATGLRLEGYAIDTATDGQTAIDLLGLSTYDLACLDVRMPGADGWEVCRWIRQHSVETRVIMLTAQDDITDRVRGLDLGADDYLVKPFGFAELAARIRALLRRPAAASGALVTHGGITIDTARRTVERNGLPLALSPKEFSLLRYLTLHGDRPVSAEELLEHVWDAQADPFSHVVKVTIMGLRKKLGPPDPIETMVGVGYRLAS
jgi:DNA-binding response OmpR family regulator